MPYKKTGIIICLPHVNNTFEVEGMLLFPVSVVHLLSSRHFDFIRPGYKSQAFDSKIFSAQDYLKMPI